MPAGFTTGTCKRPCGPRWACRMFGKSSLFGSDLLSLPVSSFPCSAPTWRWVEVAKARRTTLPFVPSLAIRPTDRSGLLSVRDAIAVRGEKHCGVYPRGLQHEVHGVHVTGVSVASCDFHHLETSLLCTLSVTPTSSTTTTNTTHSITRTLSSTITLFRSAPRRLISLPPPALRQQTIKLASPAELGPGIGALPLLRVTFRLIPPPSHTPSSALSPAPCHARYRTSSSMTRRRRRVRYVSKSSISTTRTSSRVPAATR